MLWIGFKEFYHYVDCAEKDQEVFRTAVSATKLSTRQYARRQIKWIRNKLLPAAKASNESCLQAGGKEDLHIYLLEVTGISFLYNYWNIYTKSHY